MAESAGHERLADLEYAFKHALTHEGSARSSACVRSSPTATSASGKPYRRTDKRDEAQEHLTTATAMYREMGMTYWLEKAETEMRELG